MEAYTIERVLATALFGDVVLCQDIYTGEQVAIKRMDLAAAKNHKTLLDHRHVAEDVGFEAQVNRKIHAGGGHPHLLRMRTDFVQDECLHFVYDYCAGGDLLDKLARETRFGTHMALKYFCDIVKAVERLHEFGFAHRDLSLENVLLDADNQCHVCDFGLACHVATVHSSRVGKKFYMAPEVVAGEDYDAVKADVWSLGMLLFEMLSGAPLFGEASASDPRFHVLQTAGPATLFQGVEDSEIVQLLTELVSLDPLKRPSMHMILQHPVVRRAMVSKMETPSSSSVVSGYMAGMASSTVVTYLNRLLLSPWRSLDPRAAGRA
ncbi:hypothetical protein DYB30_002056 [Aphanomyces astaci]|uniref:Protein kinase domain-containing protein n=2 Tax=Aphanomyces astaci TaxID=112090 RepID=A0A397CEH6_APHAT|nr:hypothetical protein DYB30_002056 [Aphanomyces astaci]RHY55075.1 hypothetical protein DYB38_007959 [Aphanomyces astaci]RHZ28088.1 hypothetical protein DYB26_001790 [Aphanomyces astaci]